MMKNDFWNVEKGEKLMEIQMKETKRYTRKEIPNSEKWTKVKGKIRKIQRKRKREEKGKQDDKYDGQETDKGAK